MRDGMTGCAKPHVRKTADAGDTWNYTQRSRLWPYIFKSSKYESVFLSASSYRGLMIALQAYSRQHRKQTAFPDAWLTI